MTSETATMPAVRERRRTGIRPPRIGLHAFLLFMAAIAVFYTGELSLGWLAASLVGLGVIFAMRQADVQSLAAGRARQARGDRRVAVAVEDT